MPVTMRDVATRAGVSVKTVSNVVNGFPHIRPETRSRVEDAIRALGYRVNVSGRNLRRGRTGMIGLGIPELRNPYFAELADSCMRAAEQRGLVLLIEQTGYTGEHELEVLRSTQRQQTDGLLFSPMTMDPDDLAPFQVDYPLVLLGERVFHAGVDHVTMANREAARAATRHLIERGCRRIAVIGAHEGERMGSAALRYAGYLDALAEAGLEPDPSLVGEAGRWVRSTGAAAMSRLLDAGTAVDGVFAMNDALALGALHVLRARGVHVPHDVCVVGFDDLEEARYAEPPLTSIAPGREQIARVAVDLLVRRIEGESAVPQTVVADFELVARESTAR
ncbi:LacI family DNA-binding transcriptional regulator [Microbacterium sp. NPDC096154]|uniref:LacI family DNA-binding transcriptional regulator n=1 Tax=Microbacterium sp. NPDC096154 TaxID=3155549 RepID=UPI0033295184